MASPNNAKDSNTDPNNQDDVGKFIQGNTVGANGRPLEPNRALFRETLFEILNEPSGHSGTRPKMVKVARTLYWLATQPKQPASIKLKAIEIMRDVLGKDAMSKAGARPRARTGAVVMVETPEQPSNDMPPSRKETAIVTPTQVE